MAGNEKGDLTPLQKLARVWHNFWNTKIDITVPRTPIGVIPQTSEDASPDTHKETVGQATGKAVGAATAPLLIAGAMSSLPATLAGVGVGAATGAAGQAIGSGVANWLGGDEYTQEMFGDIGGFAGGLVGGAGGIKGLQIMRPKVRNYRIASAISKEFDNAIGATDLTGALTESKGAVSRMAEPTTNTSTGRTSLAFYERPSKITTLEKKGYPKGTRNNADLRPYSAEENKLFREQINAFAKKYGYEQVPNDLPDTELNTYARELIERHNSFYRGVEMPYLNEDKVSIIQKLGPEATQEQILRYVATHPRQPGDPLFISPQSNAGIYGSNGRTAVVKRPYHLSQDRTQWFLEGDYPIYEAAGVKTATLPEGVIIDPWSSPVFRSEETVFRNVDNQQTYHLVKDYYTPTSNSKNPTELVSTGNLRFRKWVTNLDPLSLNYATRPYQELIYKHGGKMNYLDYFKNGGIHIKKANKGKFTEYCDGKVTEECIEKGKHSASAAVRKRAVFAQNVRKWKH